MSEKQSMVMKFLRESPDGTMTLGQAVGLIGMDIYCNAPRHVGRLLSNMVRRGMIERVGRGVFRINTSRWAGLDTGKEDAP